jgi:uncharacterized membrane protein YfcA
MNIILLSIAGILSSLTLLLMLFQMLKTKTEHISFTKKIKLMICGVAAFIADSLGIGSFAIVIAICKSWKLVDDKDLPGIVNGAQILPGIIESIFFLQLVYVDIKTLIILIIGACIGGILGGLFVSHLKQQTIRIVMFIAFFSMILLILAEKLNLLAIGGTEISLIGWKLWVGFFAMIVCGILPSVGVGLFVLVQTVLFLLGLSPLVAFPIMTTAGALQQPLITLTFLFEKKILLKEVFIITIAGALTVLFVIPLISYISFELLRWFLLLTISYNAICILISYFKDKKDSLPIVS